MTAVTGQASDGDIGAAIYPETRLLSLTDTAPVGIWSSSRAQYLCAVGNVVYAYTNSPVSQLTGWTKYVLPGVVSDMVESDGTLYLRIGNDVYQFDANYTGEAGFSWQVEFPYNSAGNEYSSNIGVRKQWVALETSMSGSAALVYKYFPRNPSVSSSGPLISGSSYGINHIPIGLISESMSLGMSGSSTWSMDHFTLKFVKGSP